MSVDGLGVCIGENAMITATVKDAEGNPESGVSVTFNPGGTATTDEDGKAVTSASWSSTGRKRIEASAGDEYEPDPATATATVITGDCVVVLGEFKPVVVKAAFISVFDKEYNIVLSWSMISDWIMDIAYNQAEALAKNAAKAFLKNSDDWAREIIDSLEAVSRVLSKLSSVIEIMRQQVTFAGNALIDRTIVKLQASVKWEAYFECGRQESGTINVVSDDTPLGVGDLYFLGNLGKLKTKLGNHINMARSQLLSQIQQQRDQIRSALCP